MIDKRNIIEIASQEISSMELFLVDVLVSPSNDIEVVVDSDTRVAIEDCAALSRAIEQRLDREAEDFSLTVASAGIGMPFKVDRQFVNCVGKPVDVVMAGGGRLSGLLSGADSEAIELKYEAMELVEGKKRKQKVERIDRIKKSEIKSVCEALTIK